jgi:hypothetical protein
LDPVRNDRLGSVGALKMALIYAAKIKLLDGNSIDRFRCLCVPAVNIDRVLPSNRWLSSRTTKTGTQEKFVVRKLIGNVIEV